MKANLSYRFFNIDEVISVSYFGEIKKSLTKLTKQFIEKLLEFYKICRVLHIIMK
jgi:hypothetical protein